MSQRIEVRVLGHIYLVLTLIVFTAASSIAANYRSGWSLVVLSLLPLLVIASRYEKIFFDGARLGRRGMFALLEQLVAGRAQEFAVDNIEMIATEAIRSRRGLQRIKYLYKVLVAGDNLQIVITLTNKSKNNCHELVKRLLNMVDESKLDPRTSELKQYLNEVQARGQLLTMARQLDLNQEFTELYEMPISLVRRLANTLKLEGYMQQALRCFSFAYRSDPRNAYLLYEMARFFRSLGVIDDPRLLNRARACLRLAAFLGKDEPKLLERIGETHFERFEYKLAARCFSKALGLEPSLYRANIGLAEIALRDGKLAHVAHYYNAAAFASNDRAQRLLASREADYYGRLCSDDDYFEAEISRINKLKNFQWARNLSALMLFVFWIVALLSGRFSKELGGLAWSAVLTTSLVWITSLLLSFRYAQRIR